MTQQQFKILTKEDIEKVTDLEVKTNSFMFGDMPFDKLDDGFFTQKDLLEELSKACSWEYSCGL